MISFLKFYAKKYPDFFFLFTIISALLMIISISIYVLILLMKLIQPLIISHPFIFLIVLIIILIGLLNYSQM